MITARTVWLAMEDEDVTQRLIEIARTHSKLALEHVAKDTSPDRRKVIIGEIQALRAVREVILSRYAGQGGEIHAK